MDQDYTISPRPGRAAGAGPRRGTALLDERGRERGAAARLESSGGGRAGLGVEFLMPWRGL